MAPTVETVSGDGTVITIGGPEEKKGTAPGPGNFVSRNGGWYAAKVPKTVQIRNPLNLERWIDVPLRDEKGKLIMILDPAAVQTIHDETGGKSDHLPVVKAPQPGIEAKQRFEVMENRMGQFQENMMKVMEQQAEILQTVADALKAKKS